MANSAALQSLRDTLSLLPVEWVLWAFDGDWTMTVHEGPGLRRKGLRAGDGVGDDVRERLAKCFGGAEFLRRVERGPASARLAFGAETFFLSGAPTPGGGAIGLSLPASATQSEAPELRRVVEVARPIQAVGAEAGDLLVYSPEDPDHAGLFRRVAVEDLPAEVRFELARLRPRCDGGRGEPPAPGATRSPRAPASHLRLLP
ncbi:MAG: hypothetical protein JWM27_4222 [Gemmatimonadetes bacterium]|nr:hypothetical protein [Gemmatimonadota bacterium]